VDVRQRLAANLRRLRDQKGWSQEAYAFEAGVHRTYISDLERGARNPTITVVEKLAIPFGVTASELLQEPGQSAARGAAR
jgi:transcriptional regulator with XRE-family HTH domain